MLPLEDLMMVLRCTYILVFEYMNFNRNSCAYLSGILCMFSRVLTILFPILQVYIFIYWSWGGSLSYLLFWLYWSCNTEFMLLDLCILISCLMDFKVAMMISHRQLHKNYNLVAHKQLVYSSSFLPILFSSLSWWLDSLRQYSIQFLWSCWSWWSWDVQLSYSLTKTGKM